MPDPAMNWGDVAAMVRDWNGPFCLKGVMPVADARRTVVIGCTGIILSQHGKRQLDGARRAFDQLSEVVVAVGDRIDVMMDDGSRRVSHLRKALSLGAKAVGIGQLCLCAPAAAVQAGVERAGVERALMQMQADLVRDMQLMGFRSVSKLSRRSLRFR
jgi:L-lactate dehydrogenase (cytochrome)